MIYEAAFTLGALDAANVDVVTLLLTIGAPVASAFGAAFLFGKKIGQRTESIESSLASLQKGHAELKASMDAGDARARRIEDSLAELRSQDGSLDTAIGNMNEAMSQTVAKVEALGERVQDQEVRLAKLEQALTVLPQIGADTSAMRNDVGSLRADIAHLKGLREGDNSHAAKRGRATSR